MIAVVVDIEACEPVKDWDRPWESGLSCAVTYHPTDLFRIWQPDQVGDLAAYLNRADLIVGYNHVAYDLPVIANLSNSLIKSPTYDLCLFASAPLKRRVRTHEVLSATLGLSKTADGADAPTMWQRGDLAALWQYCTNDVLLEYLLFRHARDHGYLLVEDRGQIVACPCPRPEDVAFQF